MDELEPLSGARGPQNPVRLIRPVVKLLPPFTTLATAVGKKWSVFECEPSSLALKCRI